MERHEREALDRWIQNPWEVEAPDEDPADFEDEPEELTSEQIEAPDDGWEPYDDRPELAAARARAAMGGRGFDDPSIPHEPWAGQYTTGGRRPRWYDLDAATAASLMVLGALAVPVAGAAVWVGRRFRVVRR